MKKLLAGLGIAGALIAGVGLALVATGASADPSKRDATVVDRDGEFIFFGDFDRDNVVLSGRDTQCCLTIAAQDFISGGGAEGQACSYPNDTFKKVVCDVTSFAKVTILGNDGNDKFEVAGKRLGRINFQGGAGDDTFRGNKGAERIAGGGDDDRLIGGGGKDRIDGEDGDDRCEGSKKAKIKNCES